MPGEHLEERRLLECVELTGVRADTVAVRDDLVEKRDLAEPVATIQRVARAPRP